MNKKLKSELSQEVNPLFSFETRMRIAYVFGLAVFITLLIIGNVQALFGYGDSNKKFEAMVMLIFAVVWGWVYIVFLRNSCDRCRLHRYGQKTKGKITDIVKFPVKTIIRYEYKVEKKIYNAGSDLPNGEIRESNINLKEGATVFVLYNKKNYSDSLLYLERHVVLYKNKG